MSRVLLIQPSRLPPVQCCSTINDMTSPVSQFYTDYRKAKAQRRGYDLERCQKSAKYKIDGKSYCAFHAGIEALQILMKEDS